MSFMALRRQKGASSSVGGLGRWVMSLWQGRAARSCADARQRSADVAGLPRIVGIEVQNPNRSGQKIRKRLGIALLAPTLGDAVPEFKQHHARYVDRNTTEERLIEPGAHARGRVIDRGDDRVGVEADHS